MKTECKVICLKCTTTLKTKNNTILENTYKFHYKLKVNKLHNKGSHSSSVTIGSDSIMDDQRSIPSRGKGLFHSLCIQTGSGTDPNSYPMGFRVSYPGGKAWPGKMLNTRPLLTNSNGANWKECFVTQS